MGPRLTPYRPATSAVVSTGPRPGDHTIRTEPRDRFEHAQRRPGPRPRRHTPQVDVIVYQKLRSTKAGAETPATQGRYGALLFVLTRSTKAGAETPATRDVGPGTRAARLRSTKAGAETPATQVHAVAQVLDLPRSTKAGAETPATPSVWALPFDRVLPAQRRPGPRPRRHWTPPRDRSSTWRPLNEGRGRDPGDTRGRRGWGSVARPRSTKAGAETPATHDCDFDLSVPGQRSTKAGAETPATLDTTPGQVLDLATAQRRPGPRPRRHTWTARVGLSGSTSLNEGRGRDPGDTPYCTFAASPAATAQRRPGPRPRRHCSGVPIFRCNAFAQRRPGPRPRRHC